MQENNVKKSYLSFGYGYVLLFSMNNFLNAFVSLLSLPKKVEKGTQSLVAYMNQP